MKPTGATIIVVEDEPGVRATLCGILMEDIGYRVIGLESGADALQMIRKNHFDVIIADIRLPDISGLEILELAKETNPEAAVIMMTGYASVETAVDAVNQGAYAYFVKPVNPDEIKTAIANALKQQRLSLENKRLVESLQRSNERLLEINEELRNEIAERKRAEENLREAKRFSNGLITWMGDGFSILDSNGVHIDVNAAFCKMTGFSRGELIGVGPPHPYWPQEAYEELDRAFQKTLRGEFGSSELTFMRKNGERFPVIVTPSWIRDEGGNIISYFTTIKDITERKQMEEALKESEKKFHNLVESAPIGIAITSPDGHIIETNKAIVQMHRYDSKEEFMKMPTSTRYYDPADRERFLSLVAKGPVKDFEARRKRYDGTIFWASLSTIPQTTESGEQVLITVVQDITERKQAEEALKESEAIHRALIDLGAQVGEAVVMLQDEGSKEAVHVFCSDAWLQITGYSREELRNMKMGELIHPKDREAALARHRRRISGESIPELFELTIVRKDGTEVPIELTSAYSTYQGKRVNVVYARDITRRKQVLEALRQSEEKLRLMFEALPDGITVLDTDRKIVQINKAAARIHGYDNKEEMIGLDIFEFVAKQEHTRVKEVMKKTLKQGYLGAHEIIDLRKDRSEFPAEVSGTVLKDAPGNPTGFITITKDITERKRMENELQERNEKLQLQAEELKAQQQELMRKTKEVEEATRLKSEFLAHMSHELRTPLNAIIGFSELMLDKVPGEINEEQRQCLDDILSSGKRLLNLINQVLDLSKIESGKTELKMENIALPEVIESLARTMMPILTSRKQSLEIEIEEGIPPVYADEAKLGQVLLNLVDNSSKFTPNGGRVKIEAIKEDNWCQVSVIDNGVGIKKEDQRKLFEPFSQLDNSLRKEKGGTGLGLALVKQIVERYGGRIWVQSRYGRGSRFTFTLPLAKAN